MSGCFHNFSLLFSLVSNSLTGICQCVSLYLCCLGFTKLLESINLCCAVLSCFSCVQLFVTLWTVGLQAPLSMGFSRQEYWSALARPLLGDLHNWGIKSATRCILYWQADSLPLVPPGKPVSYVNYIQMNLSKHNIWTSAWKNDSTPFHYLTQRPGNFI